MSSTLGETHPLAGHILTGNSASLVVPGMLQERQEAFRSLGNWNEPDVIVDTRLVDQWTRQSIMPHITERLSTLSVPSTSRQRACWTAPPSEDVWELLWALVAAEDFLIEDPLRAMVDQKFYLVHDVYRLIWEIRFVSCETDDPKAPKKLMGTFLRWLSGSLLEEDRQVLMSLGIHRPIQEQERADVVLFLTTLAAQNAIVSRIVLGFEGLNDILMPKQRPKLKQLQGFLRALDRWGGMGCPVRAIIGFDFDDIPRLRKLNPKLADQIQAGSVWYLRE